MVDCPGVSPISLIALIALLACSWPAWRLLLNPALRRVAPRQWTALAVVIIVAIVVIVALAVIRPAWLTVVGLVTVPVTSWVGWRGRPAFGRSRGLPPGSLSPRRSIEAVVERGFYSSQARRHGPIFKMAQFQRGVVCVVGLDLGQRLFQEHHAQLGPSVQPFNREIPGGFLRYMDDDTHRRYSSIFRTALSPPVVHASESVTRAAAREELEAMALASARGQAVSPEPYLARFVSRSFLSVLFGVQPGSDSSDEFEELYPPLRDQSLGSPLGDRAREALAGLRQWVVREAEALRAGGECQAPVSALDALVQSDEEMPDPTATDNLLFTHKISSDNVVALLRWLVKMLGDHQGWVARLRGELDSATPSNLSDRIVWETLRLAQSEYLYREIVEEFQFDGFKMPAGWLLRICVRESHADPAVFRDADTFDPDRFSAASFNSSQYSPFGFGQHACNGVHLTMMIARIWIESLCRGFVWSAVRDGPAEREFRHWSHWRPSRRLAISIRARTELSPRAMSPPEGPSERSCGSTRSDF